MANWNEISNLACQITGSKTPICAVAKLAVAGIVLVGAVAAFADEAERFSRQIK